MIPYYLKRLAGAILALCMMLSLTGTALAVYDVTPPTISDVSFDKQGQTLEPGDSFTVRFKAQDSSGISTAGALCYHDQTVSLSLSPKRYYDEETQRSYYYQYDAATELYEMTFEIPANIVSGKWYLDLLHCSDALGNYASASFYNNRIHWIMIQSIHDDITPPTISDVSIDKQGQTLEPGDSFTVRFKAQDSSGISTAGALCYHDQTVSLSLSPKRYYDEETQRSYYYQYDAATELYEMTFEIPANIVSGKWYLDLLHCSDVFGNYASASFYNNRVHWVIIIDATTVHVDGPIGTPSDSKIIDVPANKKYQIRANYGRWANYWYQINADGYVGDPITSQTKYEDIPLLQGTSINGLSNGYCYTLMEVRENATPTEKVEIPDMPEGTNYVVYELSPFDSMYEYLTTQKEVGETTIGSYDIDVSGDIPDEGVLVSFNVGTRYSGKTLYVLHYHNGKVIRYEGIVDNYGVLTVRVFGFSPFMIVEASAAPNASPSGLITYTHDDWLRDNQYDEMAPSSGLEPDKQAPAQDLFVTTPDSTTATDVDPITTPDATTLPPQTGDTVTIAGFVMIILALAAVSFIRRKA